MDLTRYSNLVVKKNNIFHLEVPRHFELSSEASKKVVVPSGHDLQDSFFGSS